MRAGRIVDRRDAGGGLAQSRAPRGGRAVAALEHAARSSPRPYASVEHPEIDAPSPQQRPRPSRSHRMVLFLCSHAVAFVDALLSSFFELIFDL